MPDITDATVVAYSDDVVRPLSEYLTGLKVYLGIQVTRWDDQIRSLLNGHIGADLVVDKSGPTGDGRVPLSKNDLVKFMAQVEHLSNLMQGLDVTQTAAGELAFEDIMKPHVTPRFPGA